MKRELQTNISLEDKTFPPVITMIMKVLHGCCWRICNCSISQEIINGNAFLILDLLLLNIINAAFTIEIQVCDEEIKRFLFQHYYSSSLKMNIISLIHNFP